MKRKRLLLLLALLMTAATGAWAQSATTTYKVDLNDGTQNPATWQGKAGDATDFGNLPLQGVAEGQNVTLKYNGRLKVKNVTATYALPWDGDLSKLTAESTAEFATATDGMTIKGALAEGVNVKVSIADGATVTLDGATISGNGGCIRCLGDATIILKDGSTNTLTSTGGEYPALSIGDANTTLTIQGSTGVLNVTSGALCAGIGGGYKNTNKTCGNIRIEGGVITAQGGKSASGIGTDCGPATCGYIIITGGTITAKGGTRAAGIGTGEGSSVQVVCGDITIANTVTKVTATAGNKAPYSIGKGGGGDASCGTVTIGCTLDTNGNPVGGTKYWENNAAVGDGATYLAQATIEYPAEEPVTLATPLTMEAITPGTIKVNMSGTLSTGMKYSVNGGTKTTITSTTVIGDLMAGDKVQFYGIGTNTSYGDDPEVKISGGTAEVKVYGNIMSLLDEEGFAMKTDLPNGSYVFYGLFKENTTLNDASELLLPAATLAANCYQQMFYYCSNLTTAPKLPATTLANSCYYMMFNGCTKLTSAYVKAAYTADGKCIAMFDGCTATGATLHTTSDNKASWEAKMGSGKTWSTWSVADDWQD